MTTAAARQAWTPAERRRVATAAARAYVTMAERSGRDVPEWLRDTAEGRPTTPPAEKP